jgi:ketosteroid isomerase-like protein
MNQHEQLIEKFYTAFQQKDWQTMQSCYHEEVTFSDPAFQNLKGKEAKAMWHMLAVSAKNFSLTFNQVKADDRKGCCHWEATYSFSRTGRKVLNKIDAYFEFKEGLILRHIDRFDFWKWTRMALGAPGILLGWSPLLQNKVRATALGGLKKFMSENATYH